jgi:hypothetical protein
MQPSMPDPAKKPKATAPRPLRIRPLAERKNLVQKEDFAKVLPPVAGFLQWFEALPEIYGSKALKLVVSRIVDARQQGREVGVSLGAHVLKVGLSPLLIDLMRRGLITHVATNGASAIHDWETAYQGATSEDVKEPARRFVRVLARDLRGTERRHEARGRTWRRPRRSDRPHDPRRRPAVPPPVGVRRSSAARHPGDRARRVRLRHHAHGSGPRRCRTRRRDA